MADLQQLQSLVAKVRQARGFTMDPVRIFALLSEEIGEVAGELKRTWSPNYDTFSKEDLQSEIADALVCLLALANQFEIDLEQALIDKLVVRDGQREWKSAAGSAPVIRPCEPCDLLTIHAIINDAAQAYRGIIPEDRWHDPYMPREELQQEIVQGVRFWGYEEGGELIGVIGLQHVQDVSLIRHAYVLTEHQRRGVGTRLLTHLRKQATRPMLAGTWADAVWAIRFYQKHGFRLLSREEKDRLLRRYWSIPERQVETSVVLADQSWFDTLARID